MNYFLVEGISNSGMGTFIECPFAYKNKLGGGLDLALGTEVHKYMLEKDKFNVSEVAKPTPRMVKLCKKLKELGGEEHLEEAFAAEDYFQRETDTPEARLDVFNSIGREYFEFIMSNDEATVLTTTVKARMEKCIASLTTNPSVMQRLEPLDTTIQVYKEHEIYWQYPVEYTVDRLYIKETVACKAKIDCWTYDPAKKLVTLNDLKTTAERMDKFFGYYSMGDGVYMFVPGSFQNYGYYRQLAFYGLAIKEYLATQNITDFEIVYNMIVVESNGHHRSAVVQVSDEWIALGTAEYQKVIPEIAYRERKGNWSDGFSLAGLPFAGNQLQ